MIRTTYRGFLVHERDDGMWNIHASKEGDVVHVAESENAAYDWIDEQKRKQRQ